MTQLDITAAIEPERGYSVHGIKPWSVLRADSRDWQQRKRWWRDQGLDDRAGRDATIWSGPKTKTHQRISGGGSTFDPVLAEICYTWYSPPGGRVIDPFAGGPTRGIVAATLGRHYHGIDLLPGQVDVNRRTSDAWPASDGTARWDCGDALTALASITDGSHSYALSCPPYWRLERYSDDPRDLSTMDWPTYQDTHRRIIAETVRALTEDSFITWVVGDLRGPDGHLIGLPWHTIAAFQAAGAQLVNDQIMVTPIGSMFWIMGRMWRPTRSATRTHQYVMTFVKGDRRKATARITEGVAR